MDKRSSQPKVITKKHIARLERERRQTNIIIGVAIGGVVLVALLLLYGYLQNNVLTKREAVAQVNGEKITTGQWQERVRLERVSLYNQLSQYQFFQQNFGMDTTQQQQEVQFTLSSPETMGDRVLNAMIDEVLIRQEGHPVLAGVGRHRRGADRSKERTVATRRLNRCVVAIAWVSRGAGADVPPLRILLWYRSCRSFGLTKVGKP